MSRDLFPFIVVSKRYGLRGDKPMSVDEVARAHGITRRRVRAIESNFVRMVAKIVAALPAKAAP